MKVALVGSAPSSRALAPFKDPSWEIWACSPDNMHRMPRVTRWFELHKGWQLWGPPNDPQDVYVEWLRYHSHPEHRAFELYMQDREDIAHATVFPKDELVEEFSPLFFTSSFSWMIALAIKSGATEIGLFGIDMTTLEEYRQQRPNFQHFMWLAREKGIRISAPGESDILQAPPLYGYSFNTAMGRKLATRRLELQRRIAEETAIRDRAADAVRQLTGSADDNDYVETTWTGTDTSRYWSVIGD